MSRAWWPSRFYEFRPWLAIAGGLALAALAFEAWLRVGEAWTFAVAIAFLAGCGLVVYGGVVLQTRRDYRKRSKWHRENP